MQRLFFWIFIIMNFFIMIICIFQMFIIGAFLIK